MDVFGAIAANDAKALAKALTQDGDANAVDGAGVPALLHATDTGNLELVNLLLQAGADLEARDNIGWTALMAAIAVGSEELVRRLLAAGANPNHVAREDTPLTTAVTDAPSVIVKQLLDHDADPDLRRPDGWTPLMLAAFRGDLDSVRALLDQGADATVTLGARLTDAATIAAANGQAQVATTLLEAADATHPDPAELWEAVRVWCEQKAPSVAGRFVSATADADVPEAWGELPTDLRLQLTRWAGGLPFFDYHGLSLSESIAVWEEKCAAVEAGEFVGKAPHRLGEDEPVARMYWNEGWIPVAKDIEGNLLLADLDPRPNGLRGQFVSWSFQDGPLSVLGSGITPWLRYFVNELRRDRVRYDPRTETLIPSTL